MNLNEMNKLEEKYLNKIMKLNEQINGLEHD